MAIFKKKDKEDFKELLAQFMKFSADEEVSDFSVIENAFAELNRQSQNQNFYDNTIGNTLGTEAQAVRALDTNKASRLTYYYSMARYQEISDAIDEICESALNYDEDGRAISMKFDDIFPSKYKKQFEEEFEKVVSPLNIEQNLYKYMKDFIVTGELCFENVVNPQKMDQGILGYSRLPAHSFEYAVDTKTNTKVGIIVKVHSVRPTDLNINNYSNDKAGRANFGQAFQQKHNVKLDNLDKSNDIISGKYLFMPFTQLMYAFLDSTNVDETVVFPLLHKVRRAYNHLLSMEDSIIIYTIGRAPVRLVFQVGMGNINPQRQRQELNKYMKKYTNKMQYDKESGTTFGARDTHLMIESMWFAAPKGAEKTEVSQIGGDASFGDIESLKYFQTKVYKALKIPLKRMFDGGDSNWTKETDQITYEEFAFAQMIIRLTNRLALGIKESFITHMKLIGSWDAVKDKVKNSSFNVEFVKPIAYDIYQQKVTLQNKMEMFERVTSTDFIDPVLAMKKYLGMSDKEVEENFKSMEDTKIRLAKIQFTADNWQEHGQATKPEEKEDF